MRLHRCRLMIGELPTAAALGNGKSWIEKRRRQWRRWQEAVEAVAGDSGREVVGTMYYN